MIDELAQRRARAASTEPLPVENDLADRVLAELRATLEGAVELTLPNGDVLQWAPDEAEALARDLIAMAARARRNGEQR